MWDGVESGPNRVPVRICCKGAPGRDRPRTKARNINDSLSALRLDRGLCNRFGQTTPPRPLGEAVTGLMATMTGASTTGRGPREDHSARENLPQRARSSLDPRDRRVTREHVCQRYVLAGQVTCSAVTRRSRGPRRRPTRPPGRPGAEIWTPRRRNVHFALESAVPTVVLECKMHVSARKARRAPAPSPPAPLTPRPRQPLRPAGV